MRIQNGSGHESKEPPVVNDNSNCNSAAPERWPRARRRRLLILPAPFVLTEKQDRLIRGIPASTTDAA